MESKISVCHLTLLHKLDDARVFYKECRSLAKNGFDVTLVGFESTDYQIVKDGVKVISINIPTKNRIEVIRKRGKVAYRKALEINADIYHIHEPELLSVARKLKQRGKKVIFDSHEFYGWQLYYGVHKPKIINVPPAFMRLYARFYMRREARICRKLDAVIAVCTFQGKNYFESRASRTVYIRNTPVINNEISQQDTNNCDSIAYIGGLTYERGVTHLIKACHKANMKLILAGNFIKKGYKEELMAMPEWECVDYRGFLNRQGMDEVMRQSCIGISNILNLGQYNSIDTFPTKVLDYMMMGLPVIISDTDFHKKMNEKYHFGLCVDPADVNKMAEAITFLRQNPEKAKEFGENGRKMIMEDWNWNVDEQRLIELYRSII